MISGGKLPREEALLDLVELLVRDVRAARESCRRSRKRSLFTRKVKKTSEPM